MAGVKFIAKRLIQWIEGSSENGHCFQNVSGLHWLNQWERSTKNIIVWDNLNEAVCFQQILTYSLDYCFFDSSLFLHHQLIIK